MKTVFISHSVKDQAIAEAFIDLILQNGLSVPISEIFCSSTDGTMIESGEDWRKAVKDSIVSAKISILLISPAFKESEVCVCEMGGSWISDAKVIPLIIEPITYKTVGVIHKPLQVEKLHDEKSLDRLKDIIHRELNIEVKQIRSDRWTAKKKEFIIKMKKHLEDNQYNVPMTRDAFDALSKDKVDLEKTVENLIEEKSQLEDLVEELKQAKDKSQVDAIVKKRRNTSHFDHFCGLCNTVKKMLSKHESIINGIIFKSYTGKEIKIGHELNRSALDEAVANDYIDDELEVKWRSTKEMEELENALDKVSNFMETDFGDDFTEAFNEEFDVPFDIKNKKFCVKVFDASITFN